MTERRMNTKTGRQKAERGLIKICRLPVLLSMAFGIACGGSEPPPKEPEAPAPPPAHHGPKMNMQSELGSIDPGETEATWKKIQPALMRCYEDGQKRLEYLGGDVKFFLRVGQDGAARYVYLVDGTLGDRKTERCMLDLAQGTSWPKPDGGEAEVQKSMGFDPPGNVRAPSDWSSDRIAVALGAHGADFAKCKAGISGSFRVTAYVQPAGKGGQVAAAGVAPPSKDGEDKADCLVDVVRKMKMPSPGSYAAKVSFTL
jgi:hypothetical protein